METTEVEVFDSLAARDELLASLGEEKGARYWSTLRAFIIAKLSKRELDAFLRETLDAGQLSLHNRLIRAVVGNAARTLPSVRERAKVLGARTSSGLWGSDRPAVPNVHHQLAPSFDFALTMPRTYPNRLKVRAPPAHAPRAKGFPSIHTHPNLDLCAHGLMTSPLVRFRAWLSPLLPRDLHGRYPNSLVRPCGRPCTAKGACAVARSRHHRPTRKFSRFVGACSPCYRRKAVRQRRSRRSRCKC